MTARPEETSPRRRRRRATTALLGAALAAGPLAAGCGVPTGSDSYEAIADDAVPNRLAEPTTTITTTTTTVASSTTAPADAAPTTESLPATPPLPVEVFFLSRGELRAVDAAAPSFPARPSDLIQLLETGPTGPTASLLDNFITAGLIQGTSTEAGVITIDLDRQRFDQIDRIDEQRAAIAQIVLTFLGNLPFVGQARFTFDGEPVRVPTGEAGFTDEPVSRDDYVNLLVDSGMSEPPADGGATSGTEPPTSEPSPPVATPPAT